jgi:glycosyltransferase involved in cell wall biosynthesis
VLFWSRKNSCGYSLWLRDAAKIKIVNSEITLCITVFNEQENLENLFEDIKHSIHFHPSLSVVLVDNGSQDSSRSLLQSFANSHQSNVALVALEKNIGYGGGLAHAARVAETEYVCFYPADRQYLASDLILLIGKFHEEKTSRSGPFVLKGTRINRTDSWQAKLVSWSYTILCIIILGVKSKDVNGLPKIAPKAYLDYLGGSLSSNFFFDAQILFIAKELENEVIEFEVSFRPRERGSSSWAGKRIQTYLRTIQEMIAFRKKMK